MKSTENPPTQSRYLPNTLRDMWADETAVSTVIAVVLMIAVTVVIGAIVGAFVFGFGQDLNQPTPNAQLTFEYNSSSDHLTIEHAGGKKLMTENTGQLRIAGLSGEGRAESWNSTRFSVSSDNRTATVTDTVEISDTIWTTEGTPDRVSAGEEVRVVWIAPDGSKSDTLGTFEAP